MTGARHSFVEMADRGVLAVGGPDARPFLQGLISNDIDQVTPTQAVYAALLTPQGKFLFDFIILQLDDELLLETERARLPQLIQRLTMYRLRSKVDLLDASARFASAALLGNDVAAALDLPERAGACRALGSGVLLIDPRLTRLGGRALLPRERFPDDLTQLGFKPASFETYDRHRLALGVPDGSRDLPVEKATLLESGFDELHGVDFQKGCFVGQELTARMKYRGLVRKRLMPVSFEGAPPEPGTIIRLDGRDAGEMRSSAEGIGLALLRLDQVAKAKDAGAPLLAGENALVPSKPDWVNF
jgi:tRNA-modifying protein YgfZ